MDLSSSEEMNDNKSESKINKSFKQILDEYVCIDQNDDFISCSEKYNKTLNTSTDLKNENKISSTNNKEKNEESEEDSNSESDDVFNNPYLTVKPFFVFDRVPSLTNSNSPISNSDAKNYGDKMKYQYNNKNVLNKNNEIDSNNDSDIENEDQIKNTSSKDMSMNSSNKDMPNSYLNSNSENKNQILISYKEENINKNEICQESEIKYNNNSNTNNNNYNDNNNNSKNEIISNYKFDVDDQTKNDSLKDIIMDNTNTDISNSYLKSYNENNDQVLSSNNEENINNNEINMNNEIENIKSNNNKDKIINKCDFDDKIEDQINNNLSKNMIKSNNNKDEIINKCDFDDKIEDQINNNLSKNMIKSNNNKDEIINKCDFDNKIEDQINNNLSKNMIMNNTNTDIFNSYLNSYNENKDQILISNNEENIIKDEINQSNEIENNNNNNNNNIFIITKNEIINNYNLEPKTKDQFSNSDNQKNIIQKNKIVELINNIEVDEDGKIKDKNFAKEIFVNKTIFTKVPIKDSYLPKTDWYSISIIDNGINIKDEDDDDYEIVLIRISNLTQPLKYFQELIRKEYILNKELLNNHDYDISPNFKGYSIFKTKAVSIFFTQNNCTLTEYFKNNNQSNDLKNVIVELVDKLSLINPDDEECFLSPTLSPNNILWSQNDLYTIIFTEIFLSIDKIDAKVNLKEIPTSKWFVPEFSQLNENKQCTLSYYSSVHSFGNILFYLLTGLEPPKSKEEWDQILDYSSNNLNNKQHNILRDIIKECINADEENPTSFSLLSTKLNNVDSALFKEPIIFNNVFGDVNNNISNDTNNISNDNNNISNDNNNISNDTNNISNDTNNISNDNNNISNDNNNISNDTNNISNDNSNISNDNSNISNDNNNKSNDTNNIYNYNNDISNDNNDKSNDANNISNDNSNISNDNNNKSNDNNNKSNDNNNISNDNNNIFNDSLKDIPSNTNYKSNDVDDIRIHSKEQEQSKESSIINSVPTVSSSTSNIDTENSQIVLNKNEKNVQSTSSSNNEEVKPIIEESEKNNEPKNSDNNNENNYTEKESNNNNKKNNQFILSENNKYLDGFIFKDINDNIDTIIIFVHIDVKLNNPIDFDIEIYDLYRPTGIGYKLLKYEFDNDSGTKYYSVAPFYICDGIKSITFGVREHLGSNREITLEYPKLKKINDFSGYKIYFKNLKYDMNLHIFKPVYKTVYTNELNYLRQISMINPKNYEYSYQYLLEITDSLSNNNLVDIILKTGFNDFTEIIIYIIKERDYSLSDISKYIEANYKIKSMEYKNAPKLIRLLNQKIESRNKSNLENYKEKEIFVGDERNKLLCDSEFLDSNEDKSTNREDIISDTIKNLNNENISYLDYINEDYCNEKIEEYNNSSEGQKKKLNVIPTKETIEKIKLISVGILSNIAIIIQGFTSAGKSFISTVSSVIHRGQYPISTALSENTTVEDLLGRFVLQRKDSSMMSFVPGILLTAYSEGRILILDECDLAKPEVLSCILRSISKDEIIVNNTIYKKMRGYNVILTMNGEAEGFTKNQRNELTSNILSKFIIVKFDKMSKDECENIFKELIPDKDNYKKYVTNFVDLYEKMLGYKQKTVDPIVTLRNLKACTYLSKVDIPVRFSAEIAYTGRFPKDERDSFRNILNKFGNDSIDKNIKNEIINRFEEDNLYYDDSYLKCAYLALAACKAGLHPLLIGKNGSGLTELAKFIACNYTYSTDSFLKDTQREHTELIQLCLETTVDDLLGCFQPNTNENKENNDKNESVDLTKLISWIDGPILKAAKKGKPVILDRIDCAKAQVIECLNPLLEENSVFNNVQFKLMEKNNKEQINIGKGFVIIGTMEIEEGKEMMSKALMNRFVAIYLDDFVLNSQSIEQITKLTIKKLNTKLDHNNNVDNTLNKNINSFSYRHGSQSLNSSLQKIANESEEESEEDSEEEGEGFHILDFLDNSKNDDIHIKNQNINDNISSKNQNGNNYSNISGEVPDWYDVKKFDNQKINDISKKNKDMKFDNLKSLIKTITKLCYIIQRTNMNVSDSYKLLELNEDIYNMKNINELIPKMLNKDDDPNRNNKFFFNEKKGNAKKMILSLISCDLSDSPVFIQGSPGCGKSVAVRYYGSFRTFRNRDPILSVSCNSEMSFEQFVGTFSFKNTSFQFIEGPLLTAMRNGEPILVDEFNLCSEDVFLNLLPLLKAEANDYVQLKGVPYQVQMKPGFLFIATGNDDNESGRKKMPQSILNELTIVKISNPTLDEYRKLLNEIINNEYKDIRVYISPLDICDIVEVMKTVAQQNFTLRQIKSLLNRIERFCTGELTDKEISSEEYRKIHVAYVIISFIIPSLTIGPERIEQLVKRIGEITVKDSNELLEFIRSDVSIVTRGTNKNFVKKGKIILCTSLKIGAYPPTMLQSYFWIRMSCSLYSDTPSQETLLLEGPTSYKSYLLEKWLELSTGKYSYEEHFVTKSTETQDLIGLSTLDDKEKLSNLIDSLIEKSILYLSMQKEDIQGVREDKLQIIMNELGVDEKGNVSRKHNYCLEYIYRCIIELMELEANYDKIKGVKTMTSFNLGIVTSACIFGQKLIIKGIDQISPSVIERINSVLEYPRSLVLTEDSQGIFNNQQIFKDLYQSNRRSIPFSENFNIYFTSRETFNGKLSEAFKSRCTIILCPSYDNKLYLGINLNIFENYSSIAKSIVNKNGNLQNGIIELYERIYKKYRIPLLSFIRWCNTTERINKYLPNIDAKYIVGIAILRSIFDGYEPNMRNLVIRELLFDYLPQDLYNLLINKTHDVVCNSPFIIEEENKDIIYVKSIYSKIQLQVLNPKIKKLEEIRWTKSAADMADSILTSLAAHTMLIFEGPPGRGKTAIAMATYEALGIDYKRINLSPSTTEEDVFARTIPIVDKEKNIKTEILKGPLYQVLSNSSDSIEYCRNGLILDEINLASNELLEQLYSFLTSLFYKDIYHTPQGEEFKIGNIGVIATMNDAKLSNARTMLSSTILNLSHTFKLPNYEPEEMKILAENILGTEELFKKKEYLIRAITCFFNSQKYVKNHSETGGVTLREILKLREFTSECPDIPLDTLLDLVLCANMSEDDASKFKNENQFTNTLSNIKLEIKNNKLFLNDLIKYDLIKFRHDGPLNKQFTLPEKDALMKILIGLTAKRTILLSGDIAIGKTYIIESLAEIIGIKLNVIQFNSETSSSDTIGRLEMCIDSNEVLKIKNELNKLVDLLVKDEWPRITSFIKFIDEGTLNPEDLINFIEKLIKKNPLKEEAMKQLQKCYDKLKDFSALSCTSFEFKKSLLINAIEKGEWVLIDDVNYAPQEIERLMSLLEENSSLTIYEQNPPVMYSRDFKENTDLIKHKQIHKNFRLFIITSNENVLSAAIKSRCLCVKLMPFVKPQNYAELISSCLANSYISDNYVISTATFVGKAFYDIKMNEKENDYILKNYILTPVNLVNLSKILINSSSINGEILSKSINYSIFSMYKNNKSEQLNRFKSSLCSKIDFNITTINRIMKDKKYILSMIERKILEYAKILSTSENKNQVINESLNKVFNSLYKTKRMANVINIKDVDEIKIFNYIQNSKSELMKNIESFTLGDIKEYKEYIEEVLCVLKELISKKEKIYMNLYYLKFFNLLLEELVSIKNTKIKGLKLSTIENSKEYFLQFGDLDYEAEKNANKLYWFRNAMNGFHFLIPENVSTIDLKLSIISIYYNYYLNKYTQLESTIKEKISKDTYIHLKMLENMELRKILRKYYFSILEKNIRNLFNILVYYKQPIYIEIGCISASKELTIEIGDKIIIRFNEKIYFLNNPYDIQTLKNELNIDNINYRYDKSIDNENYANAYMDYIIPTKLYLNNNNNLVEGKIFWFYKLFAKKYLVHNIINNGMLCEFNDAIEYILRLKIFNTKNTEKIWNCELEGILCKGYQLIYFLKYLENSLWNEYKKNEEKKVIIIEFINKIMMIKNSSSLFIACESRNKVIEIIINIINMIKNYFNKYEISIWGNMDIFINTCTSYMNEEMLKEKFEKEKIEYAKQLNNIKNKIDNICNSKNKYKFKSLYESIEKLMTKLNEKEINEIKDNINNIEKMVNMYKIANENNIVTLKKSQIFGSINNNYNYRNEYSKILEKYSKLCNIINIMKTSNYQQLFINNMFRFCDISSLESFNEVYNDSFSKECLNGEPVSNILLSELKHLANSLLISDIINMCKIQRKKYEDYLEFIKSILKNDLDCIRSIGNYFGDDDFIYLPKLDIIDLKYCVRYGLKMKETNLLIKVDIDSDTEIRKPKENETIEDYLKYLISRFDIKIDYSESIDDIVKHINETSKSKKLKETVNNLFNAAKIIKLFKNYKFKYNFDWLMYDIDEMKNEYWKEPGKIIVKNKFNSLLQFNEKESIFNEEKIIAKSLYASYESNVMNEIQYSRGKYLKDLLTEVLDRIYKSTNVDYKYGYRLVSFYCRNIYKDNTAETMVTLIYSIFNSLELTINDNILNLNTPQIKNIIISIFYKYIIDCIENKSPEFDKEELINIDKILLIVILDKYKVNYEMEKNDLETSIKNNIDYFTSNVSEMETKVCNKLSEMQDQFNIELNKYNNIINDLKIKYKNEYNIITFAKDIFNFIFSSESDIPEEIKSDHERFIKESIEENEIKRYYHCNIKKPIDYKYNKKMEEFQKKFKALKEIKELSISDWYTIRSIIFNNNLENQYTENYMDYKYMSSYINSRDKLLKSLESYFNLEKENEILLKDLQKANIPQNTTQYNIKEKNLSILRRWIKELLKCNINMEISNYKEILHSRINKKIIINKKTSEIYSTNTNWIFDKDNKPNFLLDSINVNLGIYILEHIRTNSVGSISFDNNCSSLIVYELEQDNSNAIIPYTTGNILKQNEPMNIRFRLNKNLKESETIKCEFYIKLMNNNKEECDRCKVTAILNVIPLCLKFKFNETYNIDEYNNVSINHYINTLEIEHQYPGNYSSDNFGIIINPNENNNYNKFNIKQQTGKLLSNIERQTYKSVCSNNININLNKSNLLCLNLNFITPIYYGLIIYDENEINIESIDVERGNTNSIYLFNMSNFPINISYKYNKNNIKLLKEIKSINPGEKKILKFNIDKYINSNELEINNNKIVVNIVEPPKLIIRQSYYGYYSEKIFCKCTNRNMKNKLKLVIVNEKYKIFKLDKCEYNKNLEAEIESMDKISSCYLIYNNKKIIDKKENNYKFINCRDESTVYGFIQGNFCHNKANKMDVILKLYPNNSIYSYNYGHIFSGKKMEKFSKILNNNEFKDNIQSDNLSNIQNSINILIKWKLELDENINENINNIEIIKKRKSVENIIRYLIKMSNNYNDVDAFTNYLKNMLKEMYNRECLIPYFKVNNNLIGNIKIFMEKLSYIIGFVDIVVNPGVMRDDYILDYINSSSNGEVSISSKSDNDLTDNFKKCFENGLEKDKENSELIYFNNKIYKHTKDDDFDKFNEQIENSKIDNQNYNKIKISDFIETYKNEIQYNIEKIIKNEVNITNLFNILDECTGIVAKIPLMLSTITEDEDLTYCVSNCQKIYDFICILVESPIYKTEFSEKIISTFNEIQNVLMKFEFFDLNVKETKKSKSDPKTNSTMKSIVQCEIPFDNTYDNNLLKNKKSQENYNQFVDNYNIRNTHLDNPQYISRDSENYEGEIFDSTHADNDRRASINLKKGNIYKTEFANVLSSKERESIPIPFLNNNNNIEQIKDNNSILNNNNVNDILDYENINKEKNIPMNILEASLSKTTPTEFLEMLLKPAYKNQALSEIRISELIRKGLTENGMFNYYDECSQASSFIQSTISNLIKSNLKFIDNKKILPNTILNSYVDITVDITHMSQIQRVTALVISAGLSIPLNYYGVNIRISVFGERNGVWLLSDDFSTNIGIQLARLRDALASKKRYMSFPGDTLYSLKQDWIDRFKNEHTNYTSVLISSLISPQVVNKQIDWSNYISNKIIVFGLKSIFAEEFKNKYEVYEKLLQIPITNKDQITQEFLEPINILNQNNRERNLLEILCKSLVTSCIHKSDDKDNFKENKIILNNNNNDDNNSNNNNNINNNNNNNIENEISSLKNIFKFINNNMDDKIFFGQNISHIMTDISKINEIFYPPKILLPSTSEFSQNVKTDDNGSIGNLKNTVELILKSQFGLAFAPNTSAGKIPSASGGTISIPAIKKWIVSGFTYKEIFLKKAGKTKRKYSITIVIDLSSSIHLSCNYSHAIATILLLLIAPSTLQDNDEIKLDVIISTLNGPKIMFMSSKASTFESISCINSIINVIDKEVSKFCTPGSTLNAAYQINMKRGGVGIGKNIFFITDGYVTSRKEIKFANSIISSCENSGIELMTIGVGSYPYGIKQLYPKCCYSPSLRVLGDAIAFLFSISRDPTSKEIVPQVIIDNTSVDIENNLIKMINQPPDNKILQKSIENKEMNYIEMVGDIGTMTLPENILVLNENPEKEPYYDGLFEGFNILVVVLYLGGYEYQGKIKDENITKEEFNAGAGKSLNKKGFNYKLVFSYGEAIDELTKSEGGRCPYIETWLFCSRGDGSLPIDAVDKDSNKIIPFFKCITEFNNNGGGLLLFSDNEPFTLETNILLLEYLKFEDEYGNTIRPKFSMKGNYNQPDPDKKYIVSLNPNNVDENKNGKFKYDTKLPPPGECKDRISLRPGLIKFSEGITLSYAETIDSSEDYSPFTPFAYLTDTSKERPFILYYDPKIKDKETNQGPIVVHGGFTSAFYDFKSDGTGRLVTSTACWLVRYEERLYRQIQVEMKADMIKNIPAINIPIDTKEVFTRWNIINQYSIMLLDVSGSMSNYYVSLIEMTNTIISNQKNNPNNKGTVIFFGDRAKTMINGDYRLLSVNEIKPSGAGGGTSFNNAFREAVNHIHPNGSFRNKRLLFLTDGMDNKCNIKTYCDQISNAGFSIHILGFGSGSYFDHLKKYVNENGSFQVYSNFKDISSSAIKIFAAE